MIVTKYSPRHFATDYKQILENVNAGFVLSWYRFIVNEVIFYGVYSFISYSTLCIYL